MSRYISEAAAREMVKAAGIEAVEVFPRLTKANRAEWLSQRRQSLGASDAATILGIDTPYQSRFSLWWSKQPGFATETTDDQTEEQEWGHRLEPAIAGKFAETHPGCEVFTPPAATYAHKSIPWMTCTPDRFVAGDEPSGLRVYPVELKTDQNRSRWSLDEFPDVYRAQLLWQCAVLGVNGGYLAALVDKHYREYWVQFDEVDIFDVLFAADQFWKSLEAGDPPPLDGHDETRATLIRLAPGTELDETAIVPYEVGHDYVTAYGQAKAATALKAEAENRLRAAMGDAGKAFYPDGRKIASRSVYTRSHYTCAECGHQPKPSTVDRINFAAKDET